MVIFHKIYDKRKENDYEEEEVSDYDKYINSSNSKKSEYDVISIFNDDDN